LSDVGIVPWLLLGGRQSGTSEMAQIKAMDDVGEKFVTSVK